MEEVIEEQNETIAVFHIRSYRQKMKLLLQSYKKPINKMLQSVQKVIRKNKTFAIFHGRSCRETT
jgi:hypothetical protein